MGEEVIICQICQISTISIHLTTLVTSPFQLLVESISRTTKEMDFFSVVCLYSKPS